MDVIIVGVYVDDLFLTGSNPGHIQNFKTEMMNIFYMSDLGILSYYLGLEVKQEEGVISLNQSSYAKRILEQMGMGECNPCSIPMEPRSKLSKFDEGIPVDSTLYRSVVGSLRYLVNTRPDIAYSVGIVSRYMEAPTQTHMNAIKHVLRYVKGTCNMGCVFKHGDKISRLTGFVIVILQEMWMIERVQQESYIFLGKTQ
ncbi:unnamed protein product [Cuscuta epithymum]|uniref:Reverse transcriptase Ty1/copia-type domain-containing protein n=1 Tax=Cuscuta epithymum TaxID=186058 RepID=A0AAV0G5M4_9ASTE|nr:unnamed protein product [Cuscuta epithymum]